MTEQEFIAEAKRKGKSKEETRVKFNALKESGAFTNSPFSPSKEPSVSEDSPASTPEKEGYIEDLREKKADVAGFRQALVAGVNKGLVSIADLPFDLVNLALDVFGVPEEYRTATPSGAVDTLSEAVTGYRPVEMATTPGANVDAPSERMVNTLAEYVSGGLTGGKAAQQVGEMYLKNQAKAGAKKSPVKNMLAETVTDPRFMRGEAIASTGAGLAAAPVREYADNPALEMLASVLGGGAPTAAVAGGSRIKAGFKDQFSKEGAELRVANELTEQAVDTPQAIENISNNQLILEEVFPDGGNLDAARLSEDAGIQGVIQQVAANDAGINNILSRAKDETVEQVFEELEAAGTAGDPEDLLNAVNAQTNDILDRVNSDIDLAQNEAAKLLDQAGPDVRETELGQRFVSALERSFARAKEYERSLWALVDKKVPMDGKRFRLMGARLRNQLFRRGYSNEELSLFADLNNFGRQGGINTFEGLQRFRSRILEQKREAIKAGQGGRVSALSQLDKLALQFIESGPNAESYRGAAETTRLIHQSYNKGKLGSFLQLDSQGAQRIDPEVALNRVVRIGNNIGEVRRSILAEQPFVNASGEVVDIPPAQGLTQPIVDLLMVKFAQADTPQKRATFFKQYGETLNEFPTLARDLSKIDAELETLAQVRAKAEGRAVTAEDKNVTSIAALLKADPDNIIASFSNLSKKQIKEIAQVAARDGVEGGLQTVFLEAIVDAMQKAQDGKVTSLQKVLFNNKQLGYGFGEVLTATQRSQLAKLDKISKLMQQTTPKGGSPKGWFTQAGAFAQLLAKMGGVRIASQVAPSGPASLQTAAAFSSVFKKVVDGMPSSQARRVLIEALQDPEYFKRLLQLGVSNRSEVAQIKELQMLLRGTGIRFPLTGERVMDNEEREP